MGISQYIPFLGKNNSCNDGYLPIIRNVTEITQKGEKYSTSSYMFEDVFSSSGHSRNHMKDMTSHFKGRYATRCSILVLQLDWWEKCMDGQSDKEKSDHTP